MVRYALRRAGLAIVVAFLVTLISFFLLRSSGDLAQALGGSGGTAQDVEVLRRAHGLDRPLVAQYLDWLLRTLSGDLGQSYFLKEPVLEIVAARLPVTAVLGAASLALALAVAVPLGVLAALRPRSWVDRAALTLALVGQAMPTFWFALLLMMLFSLHLGWLPPSGTDGWESFILPMLALSYYAMPAIMRLTRAGMLDVLSSDYIRTARAKGMREHTVLFKHGLRNAVIPIISLAAVQLGHMLGGSVVVESVFSLHGLGYLGWEAINRADFPVVQAIVLILAGLYVLLTLFADLLNARLDPRIRP